MKKIILVLGAGLLLGGIYCVGIDSNNNGEPEANSSLSREMTDDYFVYETQADTQEDCSSHENFDPEKKVCYFECSSENECRDIETSIDQELSSWADEKYQGNNIVEESQDQDILPESITASYGVSVGENIRIQKGAAKSIDTTIWKHISSISPDWFSDKYIEKYELFNDPKSDILASVDDDDENGKWRIMVNTTGYSDSTARERNLTIVHELGHIVTLNINQVKSSSSGCKSYSTAEGCASIGSYLNTFVTLFWSKADRLAAENNTKDLYRRDIFVTEYAASSPEEDIAESFAYFVIQDKTNGNTVRDKKINIFYTFPELVSIRDTMRAGIKSDIIHARKSI